MTDAQITGYIPANGCRSTIDGYHTEYDTRQLTPIEDGEEAHP